MEVKKLESYKSKQYAAYPSDRIDPKLKKKKEYYLKVMSCLMHNYVTNKLYVPHSWGAGQVPFSTLRLYFKGNQGNFSVKKKLLLESDERPGEFKSKLRDVFQTYDVLPEMMDVVRAINQKNDYDVSAIAIDEPSSEARKIEKGMIKFLLQKETQDLLKKTGYKAQASMDIDELKGMSEADIDTLFDTGGFQLQREIAAVAACDHTRMVCGHKEIENQCNDDLITVGMAAVRTYIDYSTAESKEAYVIPENLLIPTSKYNDFRDVTIIGELDYVTISDIKEMNPEITSEQLKELADGYVHLNPEYAEFINSMTNIDPYGADPYMQCRVMVLRAQWLSADYKSFYEAPMPNGTELFKEVDFGYNLNEQQKKKGAKVNKKRLIKRYEASWIVGTDLLLSYGEAKDQVYYGPSGNKTPKLDYHVIRTGGKSIVERCIPAVDDINLNSVKLRIAVASLPPAPRMVIQQQLLNNVRLNGIKQSPESLVQTLIERGYLIVNGLDDHGRPLFQNGKAVEFINTGLADDVNTYNSLIQDGINRLRQVIGLPEGLDGTSGNPYQGLGKQQLAAAASSNALFPTLGRLSPLFASASLAIVRNWQVIAKSKSVKVGYRPLGERTWKVLELSGDFTESDFNIELIYAPTDEQKQFLLQVISEMQSDYKATAGSIGASRAEFLMLYKLIQSGKVDMAMYKIAQIEKRREIRQSMKEARDIEANMEANTRAAQVAAEEQRKTVAAEENEKRKTAIATGAQQRKTGVSNTYLKSFDGEQRAIPEPLYNDMMAQADEEIAAALAPEEEPQMAPEEQMMMQ